MTEQLIIYLTSIILGIMLFFSFAVAPTTFKLLDEKNARSFIRGIFPIYYILNLIISLLAFFIFIFVENFSLNFYLMGMICLLFIMSNFVLMPLINKYRDSGQEKKFKISHFLSVLINFIQITLLIAILANT